MITGNIKPQTPKVKTFVLTGGLNEQITNMELTPGELLACYNYIEQDEKYHGYQSIAGYERYDGTALASSVEAAMVTEETYDDTDRELRRAAITQVPGTGEVYGVHVYDDTVYAFRNHATGNIHKATAGGWSTITESNLNDSGNLRAINYRFANYASGAEQAFFVDGVSYCQSFDGTTLTEIKPTGMDAYFPTHIIAWEERLILAYEGGTILISNTGDPTDWDASSGTAGLIELEEDVTNFVVSPGGILMIFTRNTIRFMYSGSTDSQLIFKIDIYSKSVGGINETAKNILGDIYVADDSGFTSLTADPNTSAYSTRNIGKNVYKTYISDRDYIDFSVVDRDTNRYYLFYNVPGSDTRGLVFTFANKKLKSASKFILKHSFSCICSESLSTGENVIYTGGSDGYVYKFLSGTSFDGETIPTRLVTSYYHYGTPRNWKIFKRIAMEADADLETSFNFRALFDYGETDLPKNDMRTIVRGGSPAEWGAGIWGSFIWQADSGILNRVLGYVHGIGQNMAIEVRTESKYKHQHILYNVTTDFTLGNLKR